MQKSQKTHPGTGRDVVIKAATSSRHGAFDLGVLAGWCVQSCMLLSANAI
jgi:hypothetical protein